MCTGHDGAGPCPFGITAATTAGAVSRPGMPPARHAVAGQGLVGGSQSRNPNRAAMTRSRVVVYRS